MSLTFIIPSVDKPSLRDTLESLVNQSSHNWKAIVIFNGVPGKKIILDSRIKYVKNIGDCLSLGKIKNYGIELAETEWVGFIDENDTIEPNYVKYFEIEKSKYDCIIFRMKNKDNIFPSQDVIDPKELCTDSVNNNIVFKRKLYFEGNKFETNNYNIVNTMVQNNVSIKISNKVVYIVDPSYKKCWRFTKKLIIILFIILFLYFIFRHAKKRQIPQRMESL
jgi:glycosyltransferase involved in cell wall biosynthesis